MKSTNSHNTPLLQLRGVCKSFGSVRALTDVDLEVSAGEVVALVGDNGAGKSTLIKAVAGVGPCDKGEVQFAGETVDLQTPSDSSALGIAFVFQDLALCDNLDVSENLFLGREQRRWRGPLASLDDIGMEQQTCELLDGLSVSMRSIYAPVGSLSGGQRQSIAIARALLGNPRLVILDEPTAALGVAQTAQVLELVNNLRERGLGVVLISHNLADVFSVADRIAVLRLGKNAGCFPADSKYHQQVVAAITGVDSDVEPEVLGTPAMNGQTTLEVEEIVLDRGGIRAGVMKETLI